MKKIIFFWSLLTAFFPIAQTHAALFYARAENPEDIEKIKNSFKLTRAYCRPDAPILLPINIAETVLYYYRARGTTDLQNLKVRALAMLSQERSPFYLFDSMRQHDERELLWHDQNFLPCREYNQFLRYVIRGEAGFPDENGSGDEG